MENMEKQQECNSDAHGVVSSSDDKKQNQNPERRESLLRLLDPLYNTNFQDNPCDDTLIEKSSTTDTNNAAIEETEACNSNRPLLDITELQENEKETEEITQPQEAELNNNGVKPESSGLSSSKTGAIKKILRSPRLSGSKRKSDLVYVEDEKTTANLKVLRKKIIVPRNQSTKLAFPMIDWEAAQQQIEKEFQETMAMCKHVPTEENETNPDEGLASGNSTEIDKNAVAEGLEWLPSEIVDEFLQAAEHKTDYPDKVVPQEGLVDKIRNANAKKKSAKTNMPKENAEGLLQTAKPVKNKIPEEELTSVDSNEMDTNLEDTEIPKKSAKNRKKKKNTKSPAKPISEQELDGIDSNAVAKEAKPENALVESAQSDSQNGAALLKQVQQVLQELAAAGDLDCSATSDSTLDEAKMKEEMEKFEMQSTIYLTAIESVEKIFAPVFAELRRAVQLRKKVQKHISVQDIAFSDLLEKFKVLEDLILDYAKSETECRAYIKQLFTKIQQNEQKYNALLQMGRAEMKTASQQLLKEELQYASTAKRLKTLIKRQQIKMVNLQETLEQKIKECNDLAFLFDTMSKGN